MNSFPETYPGYVPPASPAQPPVSNVGEMLAAISRRWTPEVTEVSWEQRLGEGRPMSTQDGQTSGLSPLAGGTALARTESDTHAGVIHSSVGACTGDDMTPLVLRWSSRRASEGGLSSWRPIRPDGGRCRPELTSSLPAQEAEEDPSRFRTVRRRDWTNRRSSARSTSTGSGTTSQIIAKEVIPTCSPARRHQDVVVEIEDHGRVEMAVGILVREVGTRTIFGRHRA